LQKLDHNICFSKERQFYPRKLAKIAENCDHNIDPRSKYFRGRRIHTHYDVLVEQAEFRDVSVQANSVTGVTANVVTQQKSKVVK
jgi:hypothetical protein